MGPAAAEKMLETVAPGMYERVDRMECGGEQSHVEALFVRKNLFLRTTRSKLVEAIIEEVTPIIGPECMLRVCCDITIRSRRTL